MTFKKGHIPHNTGNRGYRNKGSFKKKQIPWNKGIKTNIPRCKKCGIFLSKNKKHICKNVDLQGDRYCVQCKIKLKNKGWERYSRICGKCGKIQQRQKEKKLRIQIINDFGGKCQKCGYCKYIQCLEFHHKNKNDKKSKHFLKEIEKYPKNFKLYCNRCHREIHLERK